MKKNKKSTFFISAIVLILCGLLVMTAFATGLSNRFTSKYAKPNIGSIVNEDAYPDEIKSSSSPNTADKEWYEYITYSEKPVGGKAVQVDTNTRVYYYDPFDYSYGLIMEADTGNPDIHFSSANTIDVMVKTTHSVTAKTETSSKIESELTSKVTASVGAGMKDVYWAEVGSEITAKLSSTLETAVTITGFKEKVEQETKTYNAVYFNSYGAPYQWRLVNYTVYLPLKCDVQFLKEGTWISSGETVYCLLATVQGTCRMWIESEVPKIEHWGTGEPVTVDDFWSGFFTEQGLKDAYANKLLPSN